MTNDEERPWGINVNNAVPSDDVDIEIPEGALVDPRPGWSQDDPDGPLSAWSGDFCECECIVRMLPEGDWYWVMDGDVYWGTDSVKATASGRANSAREAMAKAEKYAHFFKKDRSREVLD